MIDLPQIRQEYNALAEKLADPELISRWEEFQELSKKRSKLEKLIKKGEELEEIKQRIQENKQIVISQEDYELTSLAEEELKILVRKEEEVEKELDRLMREEKENLPTAVIMEIRAGTGGEEAALFARNLFDMYNKYATSQGFKQTLLELNETDLHGLKETSFALEGPEVFKKMRYEGGVHRVQRIPITEKSGRIHTSTASVAVLSKPQKAQIQLNPSELKIEFYNASGPGGQNVNRRKTAVRITHLPTGIIVTSQTSRNQLKNKENAIALLQAKLLQQKEAAEQEKISGTRKAQIGDAERAEKIRTYNFPQDRITDHRIKKSWHGIENIMQGKLDELIADLSNHFKKQ
ncbi:MAG: peptide chain release factor 1 [Patescibacteria group bacterium]